MPSREKLKNAAYPPQHDQFAVGNVQHLEHAEDQGKAERSQSVETADHQT